MAYLQSVVMIIMLTFDNDVGNDDADEEKEKDGYDAQCEGTD